MRFIFLISLFFIGVNLFAQPPAEGFIKTTAVAIPPPPGGTTNIFFNDIALTTDYSRPNHERWNENSGCQTASTIVKQTYYRRFFASDLFNNDGTHKLNGKFRTKMTDAAVAGQLFAFRMATLYPDPDLGGFNDIYSYNGFFSAYPQSWYNAMAAETNPNNQVFNDGESWMVPYNAPSFLSLYQAALTTIKNFLDTAFIRPLSGTKAGQSIPAKDMIHYIDISGVGSYGEWHHCCQGNGLNTISNWLNYVDYNNPGRFASIATMKTIIDITVNTMNTYNTVIIINVLDAGFFGSGFNNTKIAAEVGIYALEKRNTAGRVGLRRDQVGNDEQYYHMILEQNTMTFTFAGKTTRADTAILNTYQHAYFVGEPQGSPANSCPNINMGCSPGQVRTLRMYSFGDGNYGGCAGVPTGAGLDSVNTAFRISGARIKLNGGSMTTTLQANASFNVTLQFQNIGLATEHRAWQTRYELRNTVTDAVAWSSSTNFTVEDFNPSGVATTTNQNFVLTGVAAGNYRLVLRIVDPTGYMDEYPLGTQGREDPDGVYQLRNNITVIPAA